MGTMTVLQDVEVRRAPEVDGDVLSMVEQYLRRFVVYPSEAARVAHVLWVAHSHRMELWESTPRLAFLSPEPGSGKSRALEVTEPLVPRPVHAVNTTPAYLFRKVADPEGRPTLLYDEIDTVFGPRAKDNEDVRGMLNAGHRRGAKAGRCVTRGANILTEELDAYCAVALAGLNDLPPTLMSRAVVVRMRRRALQETVESFRLRVHAPEGQKVGRRLASWARRVPRSSWPSMPAEITDRDADCWEPLLYMADAAGGSWPERARCAAVTLVTDANASAPTIGVELLVDLHRVFEEAGSDRLFTEDILQALNGMELAPWSDIRGKALDPRSLARRLEKYKVSPRTIRIGERTAKGYVRSDLVDTWSRYVPAFAEATMAAEEDPSASASVAVTSVTPEQSRMQFFIRDES